jgi:leucine dehydrogenase
MASPHQKTEELLLAFGRAIDRLGGVYIGAEDVGSSPNDISTIHRATRYVTGLPHHKSSGNPSSFTAWGVFRGIQAAVEQVYGSSCLKGKTVAIQGVGSVGTFLADMLFWNGAKLIVTDVSEERAKELARRYGAEYCSPEEIYSVPCDVFAPCALGGIINPRTIDALQCRIVAGAANNQLLAKQEAETLFNRGILYAPDFVINAGGLINVTDELMSDGYSPLRARDKIDKIYDQLMTIFAISKEENISTHEAAIRLGDHFLRNKIGARTQPLHFHHSV